jgi:eukaryotic-like serine/threonine-protein kinase
MLMSNEYNPKEAREIFASACDLEPDQQEAFVRNACAGRSTLFDEVMSLLRYDAITESNDGLSSTDFNLENELEVHPEQIDRYEIDSMIGRGGCGVVYKANQRVPIERVVALKLIRPGMDSGSVLRRFEFERKALERMNHPNIARVLDSGIVSSEASGSDRPYFVMEYVDGVPITRFSKDHKLSTVSIVQIMLQVCAAVQHAHSKGILHRDLKPSNILVTLLDGEPQCKVIDFGIAKALDEPLLDSINMTNVGAMIGTPRYMSPEQMGTGGDVDTRSDVYSIGVLMYELLTGESPYDLAESSQSLPALMREIESSNPVAPSTRSQTTQSSLPRDLDWITLRAMERDPARRYQTVISLADDLQRFLNNEPVNAGPPTIQYKLGKFYSRNRASVVAGLIAVVALIAGTSASVVFGLRANAALILEHEQREIAQRQSQRVEDINDFLLEDLFLSGSIEKLGPQVKLSELLDSVAPTIEKRFANDVNMRARAHYLISQMYSNASLFEKARDQANKSYELIDQLDEWSAYDLALLHGNRGVVFHELGELDNARTEYERRYAILSSIDPLPEAEIQIALSGLAAVLSSQGDYERAEPMLKEITENLLKQDPPNVYTIAATVFNRLAMLSSLDREQERLKLAEWLVDYLQDVDPEDTSGSSLVAQLHYTSALGQLGQADEAIKSVESLLTQFGERYGYESPAMVSMLKNASSITYQLNRHSQSIEYSKHALELIGKLYSPYSYESEVVTNNIAVYYNAMGDTQEFVNWRTKGLLLRIYVAGPGEGESLINLTPIGIELLGSKELWATSVTDEFSKVPDGHIYRGRYYANAAITLGALQGSEDPQTTPSLQDDFKAWFEIASEAVPYARRPDEVRRIVLGAFPTYLENIGQLDLAEQWSEQLSQ